MEGGEVIVEIIGAAADGVVCSNDRKGCLFFLLIIILLGVGAYFYYQSDNTTTNNEICGRIIYKLDNDEVLVDMDGKKKTITITHELYKNKKDGDSICVTPKIN